MAHTKILPEISMGWKLMRPTSDPIMRISVVSRKLLWSTVIGLIILVVMISTVVVC